MTPSATVPRRLRLGAFMRPVSIHTGAWRWPGAWPDANFNFGHLKRLIQTLERGRFDAFSWPTTWRCSTCPWLRCSAATRRPR